MGTRDAGFKGRSQAGARRTRARCDVILLPEAVLARRRRSVSKSVAERTTANTASVTCGARISAKPVAANSASAAIRPEDARRVVPQHRQRVVKLVGPQQQKFHAPFPVNSATTVRTTFPAGCETTHSVRHREQ